MKQVVQNYKSGELAVLDTPVPACKPGGVLVRSLFSLISVGTELMKVNEAQSSLLGKARARPDQVRKVLDAALQTGPVATYRKVVSRLDSYTPLGYSVCGVVVDVGQGVHDFSVGETVACAGNMHALHAEVNWVPRNLCVPVPAGVEARSAAFTTVGAIALQGVRQSRAQLGEMACVVGLGLVGQLVVQLLVAAGVRDVGLDPSAERRSMAEAAGAAVCAPPTSHGIGVLEGALDTGTGSAGADYVFLVAGGDSKDIVHTAARLARDRGTVIDIGKCRLDLPWNEYYEKELEVRFSRSYGPGRYDPTYELDGVDYPSAYVRWTERRNMACFLDLVAQRRVDVDALVAGVFPFERAVDVYSQLKSGELTGIGFLFEYPQPEGAEAAAPQRPAAAVASRLPARAATTARLRIGFVGAGNYASAMLLPHLTGRDDVELVRVATTTSLSAANAKRRFGFGEASTDASAVLGDESLDAVFIVTRHSSHAALVCQALGGGQTVFVEKPLALTDEDINSVVAAAETAGNDRLMIGFNRRFAPLLVHLRSRFGAPGAPVVMRYLVNAGRLAADSWYQDTQAQGSRFEGEGGHFIDTAGWWLGSRPVAVQTVSTRRRDDLLATVWFDDGSIASLAYLENGSAYYPKETIEVHAGGCTARLDNFRKVSVWTGRRPHVRRAMGGIDKGQRAQLEAFLTAVRSGGPMPIAFDSLIATTRATLAVPRSRDSGRVEPV